MRKTPLKVRLRPKKCKQCGKLFKPSAPGLPCCSFPCAVAYKQAAEKKRQSRDAKRHSVSWQLKQCQRAFNKLRKQEEFNWFAERGRLPECISCGRTHDRSGAPITDWACGHYISVGASDYLRFDRNNTFLQCNYYCNCNLSANIQGTRTTRGYRQGILERFGEKEGNAILNYIANNKHKLIKWHWLELENMRKKNFNLF